MIFIVTIEILPLPKGFHFDNPLKFGQWRRKILPFQMIRCHPRSITILHVDLFIFYRNIIGIYFLLRNDEQFSSG